MTKSTIERMVVGLKTWLATNYPSYVTRANTGTTGVQAPAIRAFDVSDVLTPGRFPQLIVSAGPVSIEATGPQVQMVTVACNVDIGVQAPNPGARETMLARYMDALVDAIGENETIGGLVLSSSLDELDKDAIPADGRGFVVATIRLSDEVTT
ncbi:MAG TPA: hypothetical protein PLW80_03125 [Spirochaetales bacterium]|nr:hypothetical protein [Spirochaetales bacterium]